MVYRFMWSIDMRLGKKKKTACFENVEQNDITLYQERTKMYSNS